MTVATLGRVSRFSGIAVEQKAHSAVIRPTSQWVRPHPGQ
jgi:hypothetical protein